MTVRQKGDGCDGSKRGENKAIKGQEPKTEMGKKKKKKKKVKYKG